MKKIAIILLALAANSDHYPFAVRWDRYEPVFKLVTGFIARTL